MTCRLLFILCACAIGVSPSRAFGHFATMTHSRVTVEPTGEVAYTLQVSAWDLSEALGRERNGAATVSEIRAGEEPLFRYFLDRVRIEADGEPCPIERRGVDNVESTELRAELRFVGRCPAQTHTLGIDYDVFFDLDPQHMGMLEVTHAGKTLRAELTHDARRYRLALTAPESPRSGGSASRLLEHAAVVILFLALAALAGKTWLLPRVRG